MKHMDNILDINKLQFVDGFYTSSDNFSDLVYEYDGSHTLSNQEITFESGDNQIDIEFETYIDGYVEYESGDYFTPSYTEAVVSDTNVDVRQVKINNQVVNLDIEAIKKLEKLILETI